MKCFRLVFAALLLVYSMFASAGDSATLEELFDVLRENGTITQQQYERLIRALEGEADVAGVGSAAEDVAEAPQDAKVKTKVKTKGGLEVSTKDGAFSFSLGGRVMLDAAYYDEDKTKLGDGTEVRRARLEAEGRLFHDWTYELGVDFAGGSSDVKNAYIGYEGWWPASFKMGQFKEPFSLEEMTSSKYITFMEPALPNAFAPGRNIGIGAHRYWETLTAAGGLFGEAFDSDPDDEGDEGWGAAGRLTYAPLHLETRAVHLGAAAEYRKPDDSDEIRFRTLPESHVTDVRYANTDITIDKDKVKILEVDNTVKYVLEAAGVWGPFSVQGEYIHTDVNRNSGFEDVSFDGWYTFASWFLTGESRRYRARNGAFGRIKPQHRYGAWELAARYSTIDLSDGPVTGGEEKNITLGLNWYINSQLRAMANYIIIDNDDDANDAGDADGGDDPKVFQLRLQADF